MTTPPSPRQPTAAKLRELVAKWREQAAGNRIVARDTQPGRPSDATLLAIAYSELTVAKELEALLGDSDAVCKCGDHLQSDDERRWGLCYTDAMLIADEFVRERTARCDQVINHLNGTYVCGREQGHTSMHAEIHGYPAVQPIASNTGASPLPRSRRRPRCAGW